MASGASSSSSAPRMVMVDRSRRNGGTGRPQASEVFIDHPRSSTPVKLDDESVVDSGYSSRDSSQVATPSRPGLSASGTGTSSLLTELGTELRLSSTRTMLSFDSRIDDLHVSRFYSIQSTIETLLFQYIKRKSFLRSTTRHTPMSVRLMLLGNTRQDAKPHIVAFCAREMRKRVQHFFDTDELVKAFYKPEDPSLPSFEVAVSGSAPKLRNGEMYIEVICDSMADMGAVEGFKYRTAFEGTFCGTPIQLQANGKASNATLGGVVKVEFPTGGSTLYGLTAGHPARACLEDGRDLGESDDQGSVDSVSTYSGSDWDPTDSEEDPDESPSAEPTSHKGVGNENDSDAWAFEQPQGIGGVLSCANCLWGGGESSVCSYDWALVEINECKPNRLPVMMFRDKLHEWSSGITEYRRKSPADPEGLSEDRVVLMCGSSGAKYGRLAAQPARIMVGPNSKFVDTYLVNMDGGDTLVDGDSGSWAVTEDTHQIIGQIVATDPLGAGYIIPLCDIFKDIQRALGASAVSLPLPSDIIAEKRKVVQANAADEKTPLPASNTPDIDRAADANDHWRSIEENHLNGDLFPVSTGSLSLPPSPPRHELSRRDSAYYGQLPDLHHVAFPELPSRSKAESVYTDSGYSSYSGCSSRSSPSYPDYSLPGESSNESSSRRRVRSRDRIIIPNSTRTKNRERPRVVIVEPREDVSGSRHHHRRNAVTIDNNGNGSAGSSYYIVDTPPRRHRRSSIESTDDMEAVQRIRERLAPANRSVRFVTEAEAERNEDIRRRIEAANAEIAARPVVRAPSSAARNRLFELGDLPEKASEQEADSENGYAQSMKRVWVNRRDKREGTADKAAARDAQLKEELERQQQRLKERLMPSRRATVGPGTRRTRVLYDDGTYRWE